MCIIWRQQPYFDSHSFTRILGGRPRVPPSSFVLSANACCRPTPLNSLRFSPQTNALNFVVHSHSAEHSRVQRSKEWKARRKVFNFFFLSFSVFLSFPPFAAFLYLFLVFSCLLLVRCECCLLWQYHYMLYAIGSAANSCKVVLFADFSLDDCAFCYGVCRCRQAWVIF